MSGLIWPLRKTVIPHPFWEEILIHSVTPFLLSGSSTCLASTYWVVSLLLRAVGILLVGGWKC